MTFSLRCDLDGDGTEAEACAGDDCDDGAAAVHAAATEVCDGVDNNCDGQTDEADASDALLWYADADGDGYGDPAAAVTSCDQPRDTVDNAQDCDDTNRAISPDDAEKCDGVDNDCDGSVDEADATDASTWYTDGDGDGYGDPDAPVAACGDQPVGTVGDDRDCNDASAEQAPGVAEVCDGLDNNCDGAVDETGC